MKKRLVFVITAICLVATFCQAQKARFYGSGKLSCSLINRIAQDSYGFIWIATEDGLNKFDGWNFTRYFHNERDSTSLAGNYTQAFLNDSKGRLWIGSGKGLQYYVPYADTFCPVKFLDGNSPSVINMTELHSGEIFAVTAGMGIYSVNKETMEATSLERINDLCGSLFMNYVFEDKSGYLWIALRGRLARITSDLKKVEFYDLPSGPSGKIYDMLEDNEQRLWVAYASNVYLWDNKHCNFIPIDNQGEEFTVRGMLLSKNGHIYVNTTGGGIKYIDVEARKLCTYYRKGIPTGANISALLEDRGGNLWMGCYKKGLLLLSSEPRQFDFWDFTSITSPYKNSLTSVYGDKEGNIWAATEKELFKYNKSGEVLASYSIGTDVISMLEDSEGTFWLGSFFGTFAQFNKQAGTIKELPYFKNRAIKKIIEGKDNALYFSVHGDGFARYDLRNRKWSQITDTTRLSTTMRLANNWINTMFCDSEGMIWLGHCKGINCYDPKTNQFLKLKCGSALLTSLCYALLEDKDGHIWMGTNNGLFEYDKQTEELKHYGIEEGVPSNVICGLGQGKDGDIWCSTYNGICRLKSGTRKVVNYFTGTGLVDREYLQGLYFQDTEGYIYLGGTGGITKFMPDSVGTQTPLYPPVLTNLYLNNKVVSANTMIGGEPIADAVWMDAKAVRLSYEYDIFSFEFSTIGFHECENIRFEYRLIELSEVWRSTSPGENKITYNHLPSGYYTLEVRSCENEVNSPVRTISIYIAPPWYDTVCAKIGYILLLIGILCWGIYIWTLRQRRRRRDEINEEKLKFFINIAHELRSPITLITSPLTSLVKAETDPTKKKSLQTMQRNANRILNLINQLLDIRKIDKGQMKIVCRETEMVGFIEDLFRLFDYQALKRNIQFTFAREVKELPVWIDRNNFDKVLMNLLVNAFKYTPDGGEITMTLATGEEKYARGGLFRYAEITIVDSGMGLDEKKLERIFERFYQASTNSHGFGIGLNLTKMLVELHHGSISAANRADKQGSVFTVRIPLGKEHLKADELAETAASVSEVPVRLALKEDTCWEPNEDKIELVKKCGQCKVLVVDDDEEIREYLKQELGVFYKMVTACNGEEAYQIALQQKIDLIISDVVMPEMDGFELLKKAKTNVNISHIPIILLTSQAEYHNRIKGWNVGADAFVSKPFVVEELMVICENLISSRTKLKGRFGAGQEVEDKMKPIEVKANDEFFMERLMNAMNENISDSKFSVEDLAEAVGVSRVQLHRKLKNLTGDTTSDFIRNIRLKQAAKLLKEKKVNVSQIAYLVGFTSPTMFSIAFKKLYGCSPSEYAEREENQ